MKNLIEILQFGWPYSRRYWQRVLPGVVLALLCGP